jgi:large subunit ribosomal protein L4
MTEERTVPEAPQPAERPDARAAPDVSGPDGSRTGEATEVEVRTTAGEVVDWVTLDGSVFGAPVNVAVMHQVVRAQLAAARAGTHSTKRRGEVRGGGRKPWRQKGTGRARQGSIRAPHWTGGGVVFGPKPRDHGFRVPKKMRALALRSALTDRARSGRVAVVDRLTFEAPRTKEALRVLGALGVSGRALVVLEGRDETVARSFRNLPEVHVLAADQLNTHDVLLADWVVFTRPALEQVTARLAARAGRRRGAGAVGGDEG